jgi:anthranilate/para-aminobenzoate synthase component II
MTADAAPTSAGAVRDLAGGFRAVLGVCVGLQVVAGCDAATWAVRRHRQNRAALTPAPGHPQAVRMVHARQPH